MTTADIYNWLFSNIPTDDAQAKLVWANMASYCYFINALDFDHIYNDSLQRLLQVSQTLGIQIPDSNHSKVLDIAKYMRSSGSVAEIGEKLNELHYAG